MCILLLSHRVSSKSYTKTMLILWAREIDEYVRKTDLLPDSLSDVPQEKRYAYDFKDGWGNKIIYEVTPAGKVTLLSYGKDGKKGGVGEDRDQMVSFNPRDPNSIYNDVYGTESP